MPRQGAAKKLPRQGAGGCLTRNKTQNFVTKHKSKPELKPYSKSSTKHEPKIKVKRFSFCHNPPA